MAKETLCTECNGDGFYLVEKKHWIPDPLSFFTLSDLTLCSTCLGYGKLKKN